MPIKYVFEVAKKVPSPTEIVVYQNERDALGRLPSLQLGPHRYAMMADWLTARVRDGVPQEGPRYRRHVVGRRRSARAGLKWTAVERL